MHMSSETECLVHPRSPSDCSSLEWVVQNMVKPDDVARVISRSEAGKGVLHPAVSLASSLPGIECPRSDGDRFVPDADRLVAEFEMEETVNAVGPTPFPSSVDVLGRHYTIGYAPRPLPDGVGDADDPNAVGRSNHHKLSIWIDDSINPRLQRETLLHEIIHAVLSVGTSDISNLLRGHDRMDMVTFDYEEWFVEAIDAGLLTVMVDNPEVVSFLRSV
jgi:hypothetical protein